MGGVGSCWQTVRENMETAFAMLPKVLLLDEANEGIQPNIFRQIGRVDWLFEAQGR